MESEYSTLYQLIEAMLKSIKRCLAVEFFLGILVFESPQFHLSNLWGQLDNLFQLFVPLRLHLDKTARCAHRCLRPRAALGSTVCS